MPTDTQELTYQDFLDSLEGMEPTEARNAMEEHLVQFLMFEFSSRLVPLIDLVMADLRKNPPMQVLVAAAEVVGLPSYATEVMEAWDQAMAEYIKYAGDFGPGALPMHTAQPMVPKQVHTSLLQLIEMGVEGEWSESELESAMKYMLVPDVEDFATTEAWEKQVLSIGRATATAQFNAKQFQQASIQGKYKLWVTQEDDRVRDSHRDLHGELLWSEEYFSGYSGLMMFPGDTSSGAGPADWANCRCVLELLTEEEVEKLYGEKIKVDPPIESPVPSYPPMETPSSGPGVPSSGHYVGTNNDTWRQLNNEWMNKGGGASDATYYYTGSGYRDYRNYLTHGPGHFTDKRDATRIGMWIEDMDEDIRMHGPVLDRDSVFLRGERAEGDYDPAEHYHVGEYVVQPSYTSVTTEPSTAHLFSGVGSGDGWEIQVRAPAGSQVGIGLPEEYELIIPRNARFRVVDKDISARRVVLDWEAF